MLLAKCVELALDEGLPVTARLLQKRFGGDWARIEDQLNALAKKGVLKKYIAKRTGIGPYTAYLKK